MDGDLPTEDFHLISSCPCWAYTSTLKIAHKKRGLDSLTLAFYVGVGLNRSLRSLGRVEARPLTKRFRAKKDEELTLRL